jgi:hypothetical protein
MKVNQVSIIGVNDLPPSLYQRATAKQIINLLKRVDEKEEFLISLFKVPELPVILDGENTKD